MTKGTASAKNGQVFSTTVGMSVTNKGPEVNSRLRLATSANGGTDYGQEASPRSEHAATPRAKSSIPGCYRDRMAVCLREFDRDGTIHEQ